MKKILLIALIVSGCSSKPIKQLVAPPFQEAKAIKTKIIQGNHSFKTANDSEELARIYLSALELASLGEKQKACKLFRDLAGNELFPLNQAALVHSLKHCSYSKSEIKNIWRTTFVDAYLKESYVESSLQLAEKYQLSESIADFSFELAAFKKVKSEKIELIQKAILTAKALGDLDRETKYFKRLTEISPLYNIDINKENIYSIAKDFETSRNFEKARDLYLEIINGDYSIEEKVKAYNSYRTSFKVARDLKMFLEKTGEMELYFRQLLDISPEDAPIQEAWVDSKINFARAVWTEHMNPEARSILEDALERKMGTPHQLATIYWIYGSLHLESKENEDALKKFELASTFPVNKLDLQENIQWAVVWNKYLLKKFGSLLKDVDQFSKKSNNPSFVIKLNFWKAQALKKMRRTDQANEIFAELISKDSLGYYGLLSSMELKKTLTPIAPQVATQNPSGNLILDWLIAVDEKEFSIKVLKEINSQFKTIQDREKAMSLYALTTWFQGGMIQINNFPLKSREELTKKYISVVYPTPYQDIYSRYSQKYKIPQALTYAISRQESAFNTNARSWADAFGLMQLIPEKAAELAKKHAISYNQIEDLYQPEINVEMGSALLADLSKSFSGKMAQTVASYNASSAAVRVWEKERFNGSYIEFIEMIPYEETRNYIKHVFRNYMNYRRVLEKKEILIPEDFFSKAFN